MTKEKCKNCGEVIKGDEVSLMCKQVDDLNAALKEANKIIRSAALERGMHESKFRKMLLDNP